jgi:hypothetical protein
LALDALEAIEDVLDGEMLGPKEWGSFGHQRGNAMNSETFHRNSEKEEPRWPLLPGISIIRRISGQRI